MDETALTLEQLTCRETQCGAKRKCKKRNDLFPVCDSETSIDCRSCRSDTELTHSLNMIEYDEMPFSLSSTFQGEAEYFQFASISRPGRPGSFMDRQEQKCCNTKAITVARIWNKEPKALGRPAASLVIRAAALHQTAGRHLGPAGSINMRRAVKSENWKQKQWQHKINRRNVSRQGNSGVRKIFQEILLENPTLSCLDPSEWFQSCCFFIVLGFTWASRPLALRKYSLAERSLPLRFFKTEVEKFQKYCMAFGLY